MSKSIGKISRSMSGLLISKNLRKKEGNALTGMRTIISKRDCPKI
jgi:hypothetical protein